MGYHGRNGLLCKAYLEQYRPDLYIALVASEKLHEHCTEIDATARERIELIMPELAKSAGATEELKSKDPMKWAGLMNACRKQVDNDIKYKSTCI
ncbi:MAG: TnpV protein [Lachnospiraceae bacterium]|nr:TnpV protein [Lachnospiraceae bacterium]MBF1003774.1 TnpV protein [Lachnospiraceae bacterium]